MVKYLLCKHEDQNLTPRTCMWQHLLVILSTREADAGRSLGLNEFHVNQRTCLKQTNRPKPKPKHVHTWVYIYTHTKSISGMVAHAYNLSIGEERQRQEGQ